MLLFSGCTKNGKENSDNPVTQDQENENTAKDSSALTPAAGEGTDEKASEAEKTQEPKEPVQITIWHDKEEAVAAVLQAELDKLAPDIVVTLVKRKGLRIL